MIANKIILAFLAILLTLSLASALNLEISSNSPLSRSVNTTSFSIKNNEAFALNVSVSVPSSINDTAILLPLTSSGSLQFQLQPGNTSNFNLTRSAIPSNYRLGQFTAQFNITATNSSGDLPSEIKSATVTMANSFCDFGSRGALTITRVRDENKGNEKEWEWNPLDEIEVNVKIRNDVNDDLDIVVEYGLYDVTANEFIDLDEDTQDIQIDEGEYGEVNLDFQMPIDVEEDHLYRFYVKAYEDGNEEEICADTVQGDYYRELKDINKETRDVAVKITDSPDTALCGESLSVQAKVYNLGEKDEDRVKVRLLNSELRIDSSQEIRNLDSGESKSLTFNFDIPQNATQKTYTLVLDAFFDYDDNNDEYDEESTKNVDFDLVVSGNCIAPVNDTSEARITATLESEDAKAGGKIVVKATVTNTGSQSGVYNLLVSGIESFASLESISPQTFTLAAGRSQDSLITLNANNDASGEYTFSIKAISNGKIEEELATLSIEPKASLFSGSFFQSMKDNWFIWLIVAINVILIILIIVVATKIARG